MRLSASRASCLVLVSLALACSATSEPSRDRGGSGGSSGGSAGSETTGGSAGSTSGGSGGATGGSTSSGGSVSSGGAGVGGTAAGAAGAGAAAGAGGSAGTGQGGGTGVGCAGADIACDDFEGATIDSSKWRGIGLVSPVISTDRAHSGSQSLLFEDEGAIGRFLTHVSGFPAGGQLYFRAYMNFAKATVEMSGHTGFVVAATGDSNSNELRWGQSMAGCNAPNQLLDLNHIPSDKTICSSGHVTGGNPAEHPGPGETLEANTWYCVELFFDSVVGDFRIWIDDRELEVLRATADDWCPTNQTCPAPPDPWPMPFTLVKFGTQTYNGGAGNIWYDDVAYATQRIGCN